MSTATSTVIDTRGTRQWRRTRAHVLARDANTCQINGPHCTRRATEADHILPVRDHGTDHPTNLRAACMACNRRRPWSHTHHRGRPAAIPPSRW